MVYRSDDKSLWDSWIFPWAGAYHLFHLETSLSEDAPGFQTIGRAVSRDLVRWTKLPSINVICDQIDAWNSTIAYTGTTVHFDGQFYMFITCPKGRSAVIGAFKSSDLTNWERVSSAPQLVAGGEYLSAEGETFPDWRDIDIIRDTQGWFHGAVTAKKPDISCDSTGSVLAHVRSKDLLNWEYLPPFFDGSDKFRHMEVPGLFEWNGWHYITFNTTSLGGMRVQTPAREETGGMYYAHSRAFEGPYALSSEPMLVGGSAMVLSDYSGRVVRRGDERLIWHLFTSRVPACASAKLLRQAADGTLSAHYDTMLETLMRAERRAEPRCLDGGRWRLAGDALFGGALVRSTACALTDELADGMITVYAHPGSAARLGVIIHGAKALPGMSFLIDAERNLLSLGRCETDWTLNSTRPEVSGEYYARTELTVKRDIEREREYLIRVIFRDLYLECYLDDEYIFSWGCERAFKGAQPNGTSETGAVQLYVERGDSRFRSVRICEMDPLPRAKNGA